METLSPRLPETLHQEVVERLFTPDLWFLVHDESQKSGDFKTAAAYIRGSYDKLFAGRDIQERKYLYESALQVWGPFMLPPDSFRERDNFEATKDSSFAQQQMAARLVASSVGKVHESVIEQTYFLNYLCTLFHNGNNPEFRNWLNGVLVHASLFQSIGSSGRFEMAMPTSYQDCVEMDVRGGIDFYGFDVQQDRTICVDAKSRVGVREGVKSYKTQNYTDIDRFKERSNGVKNILTKNSRNIVDFFEIHVNPQCLPVLNGSAEKDEQQMALRSYITLPQGIRDGIIREVL